MIRTYELSHESKTPLYVQLYEAIRADILSDDDKRDVAVKHRLYRKCGRIVSAEIEICKTRKFKRFVAFHELLTCRATTTS